MTTESPDIFIAAVGDVVRISVQSVNFVINAKLDPKLTQIRADNFTKVGELTMGNAQMAFSVDYNFPNPLPAGGKYTRTVTGPGGFVDGPIDVTPAPGQTLIVLPYVLKVAPAKVGPQ